MVGVSSESGTISISTFWAPLNESQSRDTAEKNKLAYIAHANAKRPLRRLRIECGSVAERRFDSDYGFSNWLNEFLPERGRL